MFLLPLLTGLLLVFQGHGYSVHGHGSRNTAARELEDYNQLLDDLSYRYKQILDVHHKRQEDKKQKIDVPNLEWSDLSQDVRNTHEEVPQDGINFAAADADIPSNVDPVEETAYTANQDKVDGEKLGTSTDKSATESAEDPLMPHKLVAKPSGNRVNGIYKSDFLFITVVSACSVAGLIGLIMAGVCWYKLHKRVKAASDVDYPAYGVTGPTKERLPSPGDRKLAQSAQMYHYQHQKQQMIAMEKANGEMKQDGSDDDSEEENEEGDYTVYECPGLAPTGEMEVRNPLFTEETQTPVNGQPVINGVPDEKEQE